MARLALQLPLLQGTPSHSPSRTRGQCVITRAQLGPSSSRRGFLGASIAIGLAVAAPLGRAEDKPPSAQELGSAPAAPQPPPAAPQTPPGAPKAAPSEPIESSKVPLTTDQLEQQAAAKLLEEEEERRKARKRKKGRIRELTEIRAELAEKELVLLEKEKELLEKEQTVMVLREELAIEQKLRVLLTKEKEKAEEEASLAMGLCTGGSMLP